MRTVTALRHVHFEDLGSLAAPLRARGATIRYVEAPVEDLAALDAEAPDLLIVLGGPIGAFDEALYPFLATELDVVRRRLASGRPILGICLGAQLMARALGAEVRALGVKEIGFAPLKLTAEGWRSPLASLDDTPVLHWHGDQFDIPAGATWLASTVIGRNQAFAAGRNALGLQFHLEAEAGRMERWLVGHAAELFQAGIDPRNLREQARQHGPHLTSVAQDVMNAWLDNLLP
ncbi:glutamine amidotransferase [Steroidobacter denitrificans]|uniref:Glutamine amidotransferase n=1 Tax=Steroidobacter denitrificans TaxID=465721 RepID=A0A127FC94_STEDE|nr:glutamine amidotransferase [Steroidobacter denitrificans]AMN47251.1 glutamine amidotransferase [Steroidobacter denitrificans]